MLRTPPVFYLLIIWNSKRDMSLSQYGLITFTSCCPTAGKQRECRATQTFLAEAETEVQCEETKAGQSVGECFAAWDYGFLPHKTAGTGQSDSTLRPITK